jgi:hypothetical protein
VTLFDETPGPGFIGENPSIEGPLEHGCGSRRLVLPDCVLRVTAPREFRFKFNAVMGLNTAGR